MSIGESVWSTVPIGSLLFGLLLFKALRRRTADFHEGRAFKARLPQQVVWIEKLALYVSIIAVGGIVFACFAAIHPGAGVGRKIAGTTAIYASIGAALIAAPVGALLANIVSWTVPSLRSANLSAMEGTRVSFTSANRGLLLLGAAAIPLGLIALAIGFAEPWGH